MATFNNRGLKVVGGATQTVSVSTSTAPGQLLYTAPNDSTHLYSVFIAVSHSNISFPLLFTLTDQSGNAIGGSADWTAFVSSVSMDPSRVVNPNGSIGALTFDGTSFEIRTNSVMLLSGDKVYIRKQTVGHPTQDVVFYVIEYYGAE